MNELIKYIAEIGYSEQARTACVGVATIATMFFTFWYAGKLGLRKWKVLVFLLIVYPYDFMLLKLSDWITRYAYFNHFLGIQTVVSGKSKTFILLPLVSGITGKNAFPFQVVNAIVIAAIVVYLLRRSKKLDYVPDGKQYPIMLILFGSTKFLTEFLAYNEKLIFGCSILSFHALFMTIVGLVTLKIMDRKSVPGSET